MPSTDFIPKLQKIRRFLQGSQLSVVLQGPRKRAAEELLTELFGDPWQPGWREFVTEWRELQELATPWIPVIALGLMPPDIPMEAIYLVADKALKYRPAQTPSEVIRERMGRLGRRGPRR